jgi:hypothetical protein
LCFMDNHQCSKNCKENCLNVFDHIVFGCSCLYYVRVSAFLRIVRRNEARYLFLIKCCWNYVCLQKQPWSVEDVNFLWAASRASKNKMFSWCVNDW